MHKRLTALDGLRGVAILSVILYHVLVSDLIPGELRSLSLYDRVLIGWTGVDLFFVLSGFLITGILWDEREKPRYYSNFYARRTLRIFPLYYATLLVFLLLGRAVPAAQWLYAINWTLGFKGWNTGPLVMTHSWSLCIEEQFYLFWPFVVAKLRRNYLLGVCVVAIVASPILRYLVAKISPLAAYDFTICRLDALAAGAMLAMLYRNPVQWLRATRYAPVAFAIASCVFCGIVAIRGGDAFARPPMQTIGYSSVTLASASLVAASLSAASRSALKRTFESRFLRFFGKYSYCIYIVHPAVVRMCSRATHLAIARSGVNSPILWTPIAVFSVFAASAVIAMISWRCFESPILGLKRYFETGSRVESSDDKSPAPTAGLAELT